MKKLQFTLVLAAVAISLVSPVGAAEAPAADPVLAKLNEMDGKEIYKNVCKSCHGPDADAGEYTPMSLIMEQWDEFFQDTFAEAHKDLACPHDENRMLTDVFTGGLLKKVQKFCVDHAADSEQPMTCG